MVEHGVLGRQVEEKISTEPRPSAADTWRAFMRAWVRYFGFPDVIVTGMGSEFKDVFASAAGEAAVFAHVVDSKAPWQSGRTERLGGILKKQHELACDTCTPTSETENELVVWQFVMSRYRYANRSGFSADRRVSGVSHRLPASLTSDDVMDPHSLVLGSRTDDRRAHEIRMAATVAFFRLDATLGLQCAEHACSRATFDVERGDWVFIHRRGSFGNA